MPTLFRIGLFILLTWFAVAQLLYVAIPLFAFYLFRYCGYELVLLAILLDGYYFAFTEVPKITIFTLLLVISTNFIKPRLLMYTKGDETLS